VQFLTKNIWLIILAVGSAALLLWPLLQRNLAGIKQVTPNEAVLLINRSDAIVLDVRDDAEFAGGHLPEARHIPLKQLAGRLAELEKFKDKPILVHCQAGARAASACGILRQHAFAQVYNLQGGINAWVEAKLPVVKG